MRIIRFRDDTGLILRGVDRGDGHANVVDENDAPRPIAPLRITSLCAPIEPSNILCAGRNYGPGPAPEMLELFMKPTTSLGDPDGVIPLPAAGGVDPRVACEGELAVVIGREACHVDEADALHFVYGYTIANDVTARAWQRDDPPMAWMRGKGFDGFCPLGPAIVTPTEIADPAALEITTSINGRVIRSGPVSSMHRSIPNMIAEISSLITLRPGTVLLTGAPPLIDHEASDELAAGDEVRVNIDGIGTLRSTVRECRAPDVPAEPAAESST